MALYLEQLLAEVLPSSIGWSTESRYFFGKRAAEVIHAPSHTPSSCCFRVEAANGPLLLARDTLFHGSIGRTDLLGSRLSDDHAFDHAATLHARSRHCRHPRPRPAAAFALVGELG